MKKQDILNILDSELAPYADKPYNELLKYIDKEPITYAKEINNKKLQFEISFFEDDEDIVVIGAVDGGGWRSFFPITMTQIVKPKGEAHDNR